MSRTRAILADTTPCHTAFLVDDRVLNCGDSFADALLPYAGVEVLIMPVMAPFLTEVGAAGFARRIRTRRPTEIGDGLRGLDPGECLLVA